MGRRGSVCRDISGDRLVRPSRTSWDRSPGLTGSLKVWPGSLKVWPGSLKVWPGSLEVWPSSLKVWPSSSYGASRSYGASSYSTRAAQPRALAGPDFEAAGPAMGLK